MATSNAPGEARNIPLPSDASERLEALSGQMKMKPEEVRAMLLQDRIDLAEQLKDSPQLVQEAEALRGYLRGLKEASDARTTFKASTSPEGKGIWGWTKDALKSTGNFLWRHKGKILLGTAVAGLAGAYWGAPALLRWIAGQERMAMSAGLDWYQRFLTSMKGVVTGFAADPNAAIGTGGLYGRPEGSM